MHVGTASRRFARGTKADMPLGLPHHAHQLALALYFTAAYTRALGNVLRHLN